MNFKKLSEQKRAEWLTHVRPEIQALANRGTPVTYAEWEQLRLNSWEQEELYPCLDDEAFAKVFAHIVNNCGREVDKRRPCLVYDDALRVIFIPEILKRFQALINHSPETRDTPSAKALKKAREALAFYASCAATGTLHLAGGATAEDALTVINPYIAPTS
jgi:hypothetical protein